MQSIQKIFISEAGWIFWINPTKIISNKRRVVNQQFPKVVFLGIRLTKKVCPKYQHLKN
jgi:hypothetical protein